MKKRTEYTNPLNRDLNNNKDLEIDKVKTTNVNILLNRVRLDQKRILKKKIIFSLFLLSVISTLAIYFTI